MRKTLLTLATLLLLCACSQKEASPTEEAPKAQESAETNAYVFTKDGETFLGTLPDSKLIEARPFDSCGDVDKYKVRPWFGPLEKRIEETKNLPQYSPLGGTDLIELCQSLDEDIVIGLFGGVYCSSGFVFRYDVLNDELEVAKFLEDRNVQCPGNFMDFGARNGAIIPVKSSWGDAGCMSSTDFDYDFTLNTLHKTKECHSCENWVDSNGNGQFDEEDTSQVDESCEDF